MKRRLIVKMLLLAIVSCLLLPLAGCDKDGDYTVYAMNRVATKLIPYSVSIDETDTIKLTEKLFDKLCNVDGSDGVSTVPDGVSYESAQINDSVLTLNLSGNMDGVSNSRIMLFYAACTRTLLQKEELSGLIMNLNGEMVKDGNGLNMGLMRPGRFVNNAVDNPDDYKESEVVLYFANKNLDKLVKTTRVVNYRSSTPIEKVVVEAIIAGAKKSDNAQETSAYSTVPSTLMLIGINTRDGICYVNLDKQFVNDTVSSHDEIAVYSIVNSLMELQNISGVQISINGSSDVSMPISQIDFKNPLIFNDEIVE